LANKIIVVVVVVDLREWYCRYGCGEWTWDWRCYTGKISRQSSLW